MYNMLKDWLIKRNGIKLNEHGETWKPRLSMMREEQQNSNSVGHDHTSKFNLISRIDARIEKFQNLLGAPLCWEKHEASLHIYKQPQCWLLNMPQYKKWCSKDSGLLWCHAKRKHQILCIVAAPDYGLAGAGKTVLR